MAFSSCVVKESLNLFQERSFVFHRFKENCPKEVEEIKEKLAQEGSTYPHHSESQAEPHPAEGFPSGKLGVGNEGYLSQSSYSSANRPARPTGSHS